MTVIGSAYVNIRAITDKLESDIRKSIESIKDSITLTVDADVTSATAKIEELANTSLEDQTMVVDADTTPARIALDEIANMALGDQTITVHADTTQAVADIANISHLQSQPINIPVNVDTTEASRQLHDARTVWSESINATIDANTLPARAEFDNMLDDMGHANDPTITPNVNDAAARLRLALLTARRKIKVDFDVLVNESSAKAIGSYMSRLSGLRVATSNAKELVHEFANIDKAVPAISMAAVKFGTMAAAILSASQGALTLGASLVSVIQLVGFAAPGMIAGFMVGIGTLMVALKDFKNQLPGVVAEYKTLGAVIKENFWSVARNEVAEMANTLFPAFKSGLADTSKALGGWVFSLAYALKIGLSNNVLEGMFNRLSDSIKIASEANGPLVDGMIKLGQVGSDLLPRLARWWVDVATKFDNFISGAVASGEMSKWIEEGITALHQLGRVVSDVAHIFDTLTGAAQIAGSDGLGTVVKVLDNIRSAVNSPEGASALITIFQGVNVAAGALGKGLSDIFGAIGSASPAIKSAFESIGGVINVVSGAISQIIANPEFQAGFTAMFDGIQKGAEALLPVLGTTGPKIGALLSIIGNLAANIGGILGKALEITLPFITAFKQAIDPLIPILGDALIKIIGDLGPTFTILAKAIADVAPAVADVVKWVADLIVGLVDTLGPALPGIVAGVLAFMAVMKTWSVISAVTTVIKDIAAGIQLLTTANSFLEASQVSVNLAFLANPVVLVIAGIVALVAAIVVAYNNVGWFKDFVDQSIGMIVDAVGHLVDFWNNSVVPMWNDAMKVAGDFFGAIGKWIGEAVTNVKNFFDGFGKGAGDAGNSIGDFFKGIGGLVTDALGAAGDWFSGIGKGISDAFNGVVDFVSGVINTIVSVITTGVQIYIGIWVTAWTIVSETFMNIWNNLVSFFSPLTELITAIVKGFIDIVVAIWQVGWDIISTIFYGIWINLVRFFTPVVEMIQQTITSFIDTVVSVWNSTWQGISDFFTAVWNSIVAFVTPIVQSISDTITNVVNGIQTAWNSVWQGIVDYFTMVWNLMVAIYSPILNGIRDTVTNVVNGISAAWNTTWSAISTAFTDVWNGIINFVTPIINTIRAVISVAISAIQSGWNSTWSAVGSFFTNVWNNIVNGVTGFVQSVQAKIQEVIDTAGRIGSDILRGIGDLGKTLYNAGSDLIRGLANGITDMTSWVVDKVKNVGASVVDGLKNFFGIKSPSRVMRDQVGKQLGAGLAIGIEQSVSRVAKASQLLAEAAMPNISDIVLPSIKAAPVGVNDAQNAPVLTRSSVTGTTSTAGPAQSPFGGTPGAVTNVNFNVHPSQGLNEEQIGEFAMNTFYWKLASTIG